MKTLISAGTCWAVMVLTCGSACAQETSRVQDVSQNISSVDASVHASVDEQPGPQLQQFQRAHKQPEEYSRWAIPPTKQQPTTLFWPTQTSITIPKSAADGGDSHLTVDSLSSYKETQRPKPTTWSVHPIDSTNTLTTDSSFGKSRLQATSFGTSSVDRSYNNPARYGLLKTADRQPTPQPLAGKLQTEFSQKQPGIGTGLAFPSSTAKTAFPSSRMEAKAKPHKRHPHKSVDPSHEEQSHSPRTR